MFMNINSQFNNHQNNMFVFKWSQLLQVESEEIEFYMQIYKL